jgi:2-polyprenyl-6-hydroxyphenyl methylase/3-demethylubiquinone-9 3-methyltransferase
MNNAAGEDTREIAHFDRLASRWWDPAGEFATLHALNPLRTQYIADRASLPGRRLLDIGCGGGLLSESLAALGARVTGIDLAPASLAVARLHLLETPHLQVDYRQVSAEDLAASGPASYDVVTCMEVLEHVSAPQRLLEAIGRLVRPSGDVFLATINRTPRAFLGAIVGAEYLLELVPRGTHRYEQLIKPSELARWARAAGLGLVSMTGVHYQPVTGRFSLADDAGVNYMMHLRRPPAPGGA